MIKVGYYLKNSNVSEVDLSNPEAGNPGVGGTQFNFVTLPYYMDIHNGKNFKNKWYANSTKKLPVELPSVEVKSSIDAARKAKEDGCDIFIFRPTEDTERSHLIDELQSLNLTSIAWGHNVPLPVSHLNQLAESPQVSRFVVVGRERYDQIRDHKIFYKSRCIYNGFDPKAYIPSKVEIYPPLTVAYVGSLVPSKGFHILAEAWPSILDEFPSARLVVIGSGRLYDRNATLGKWGLAAEKYEQQFRPFLSDSSGNIHSSVHFKGTLGTEKISLLQKADVGVVNPSGRTENCPGSAIEFQASGTPVVSSARWGLLDTVLDGKTGILCDKPRNIDNAIIKLLGKPNKRIRFGKAGIVFVKNKFSYKKILNKWCLLFERVLENKNTKIESIKGNLFHRYKWLREVMRIMKKWIPILRRIPPLFDITRRFRVIADNII